MPVQSFNSVFPVPDLPGAVAFWSRLLGVEPTFVDGDRWAQFDIDGRRLALAGTDRFADEPGLMVKVDDVEQARGVLVGAGVEAGPVEDGAHERRCTISAPGGWTIVLYSPLRPKQ